MMDRETFYSQISGWILDQLNRVPKRPAIIGINGPQGIGKSTLAAALVSRFEQQGLHAISVSIDDFYLTRADQRTLAAQNPNCPYLQNRGYPGTHDVELGVKILTALKNKKSIHIPRYDKSAHSGKGDRSPLVVWTHVEGPQDVVLLDGWMLGFQPRADLPLPGFEAINEYLAQYSRWHSFLDGMVILKPKVFTDFIDWRVEAEEKMKASGRGGMGREEIEAYVRSFIPAYQTYYETLNSQPVCSNTLRFEIGRNRLP